MKLLPWLPLLLLALLLSPRAHALPLSTHGRWVVDSATGQRVKLRCVNWAGHMPAVLPEGLNRKPVSTIAALVASLGFNCVRLTWATYLWTDDDRYGGLTVGQSLQSLGLGESLKGVAQHNQGMMRLTVREAYDAVVRALVDAGLMVVLDNHVSRPQWCCDREDGNGFFGDLYFDTDEWVRGLEIVAKRFRGFSQVVGMSMRNELRGPNENEPAWYRNIERGANTIHRANPNVLIIVSGMNFDTDLSFLAQQPLTGHYSNKLVLEAHWYSFSFGRPQDWAEKPLAEVCSDTVRRFDQRAGFVTFMGNGTVPLFLSEFGGDQRGTNLADNSFLSCFMAFAAERDLDWALWALQGSYYRRDGVEGFEEAYGVLDTAWDRPRNPQFRERFRLIQDMIQDPRSSIAIYQLIYHPSTGQCLSVDGQKSVVLGDCEGRARWNYTDGASIMLLGINATSCLRLAGDGQPVQLSDKCDDLQSSWRVGSSIGLGLISKDANGRDLCMDRESTNSPVILTRECLCLDGSACSDDPQRQWFKIISSKLVLTWPAGYPLLSQERCFKFNLSSCETWDLIWIISFGCCVCIGLRVITSLFLKRKKRKNNKYNCLTFF